MTARNVPKPLDDYGRVASDLLRVKVLDGSIASHVNPTYVDQFADVIGAVAAQEESPKRIAGVVLLAARELLHVALARATGQHPGEPGKAADVVYPRAVIVMFEALEATGFALFNDVSLEEVLGT